MILLWCTVMIRRQGGKWQEEKRTRGQHVELRHHFPWVLWRKLVGTLSTTSYVTCSNLQIPVFISLRNQSKHQQCCCLLFANMTLVDGFSYLPQTALLVPQRSRIFYCLWVVWLKLSTKVCDNDNLCDLIFIELRHDFETCLLRIILVSRGAFSAESSTSIFRTRIIWDICRFTTCVLTSLQVHSPPSVAIFFERTQELVPFMETSLESFAYPPTFLASSSFPRSQSEFLRCCK